MSGKPIFIDIASQHKYTDPLGTIRDFELIQQKARTKENSEEWDRANDSVKIFHHNPKDWWVLRRTNNNLITPQNSNNNRSIEITLEEIADKEKSDRIFDWLYDDSLQDDVFITHYQVDREVTIEITERKRHGFFMKEETRTEKRIEKMLCIGFVFKNVEDAVQFKLACL